MEQTSPIMLPPSSSTDQSESTANNSFHLFPLLPRELRDQIWEDAIIIPPAIHELQPHSDYSPDGPRTKIKPAHTWTVCSFRQALMQTCRASRTAVLHRLTKIPREALPFSLRLSQSKGCQLLNMIDFDQDLVLVRNFRVLVEGENEGNNRPAILQMRMLHRRTRRLAVSLAPFLSARPLTSLFEVLTELMRMLERFERLEVVYLVHEPVRVPLGQRGPPAWIDGLGRGFCAIERREVETTAMVAQTEVLRQTVAATWHNYLAWDTTGRIKSRNIQIQLIARAS